MGSIQLKLQTSAKIKQGYIFEIVKGKLRNANFNYYIKPVTSLMKDNSIYELQWGDKNSNSQQPFDIMLKITAVSRSGVKSKPQFLRISHPGVRVPWWNIWKRLPPNFTQAIEHDSFTQVLNNIKKPNE